MYFRYISVLREKDRYKVLRYLGCILPGPKNGLITHLNVLKGQKCDYLKNEKRYSKKENAILLYFQKPFK